jgi:hypothetical protein
MAIKIGSANPLPAIAALTFINDTLNNERNNIETSGDQSDPPPLTVTCSIGWRGPQGRYAISATGVGLVGSQMWTRDVERVQRNYGRKREPFF